MNRTLLISALLLCNLPLLAQAQTPPDAGQTLRHLQEQPIQLPAEPSVNLQLPEDNAGAPVAPAGPSLHVSSFALSGNQTIPDIVLLPLLDDMTGQVQTLGDLENAAARITRHYREQGYLLARAYIPAQTIENGVVRIEVVEGRYGALVIENPTRLREYGLAPLKSLAEGQIVEAASLERSLLLLDQRSGVAVGALLQPGSTPGTTNLQVALEETPLLTGSVRYDNQGGRYTGEDRLTTSLNVNNVTGLGDQLNLALMATLEDQYYYALGYQLPLGAWGTSVGANASYMDYELGDTYEDLGAHGTARTLSLFVNQLLIVSRALSLNARLAYENRDLTDEMDSFSSRSDKTSDVLRLSLEGSSRDAFLGGGINSFSLLLSYGDLALESEADRVLDAASAQTDGNFLVWAPSVLRLQRLTDRFSLLARVRGQWANNNLDGSEGISAGGASGVRAYPQGELSGDEGVIANLELRHSLNPQWQTYAFVDYAWIRTNHSPWDDTKNTDELKGMGLGVVWSSGGWQVDVSAAQRLGDESQSAPDRTPRFGLQASYSF